MNVVKLFKFITLVPIICLSTLMKLHNYNFIYLPRKIIKRYIHTANSMKTELVELQDTLQEELRRLQIYDDENKEVKCKVLELLLNPKVTRFNFPFGMIWAPYSEAGYPLLRRLVEVQPPDLLTIRTDSSLFKGCQEIKPFFNKMLDRFRQLEVLRLCDVVCDNGNLREISEHLPKLRYSNLLWQ